MEAWAQLTLHGINHGGSVNVLFSVLNDRRSNTQAAVWWMPPDGTTTIALGNSSDQTVHATLEFSDSGAQDVDIAPFATEIIRRHGNQRGGHSSSKGVTDSVIVKSNAASGGLIPTGIVGSENGKFTGSIRFYDTQNAVQSNLFATRFKMKNVAPHLLLRNTTASVINAQPRFRSLAGESGNPVELPAVTLQPNEAAEVNLDSLAAAIAGRPDLDEVSVEVLSSGGAGSLVGALYGTDRTNGTVYDVPLRDSGVLRISTGGYPIRLDGDYSTIISITNVSDKESEFAAYINHEGGRYIYPARKLAAGETAVFDVRKLRDEGTPDGKGQRLPASFTTGQFLWSIHGGMGTHLLGRSEIVSRAARVSSSYSCTGCCPWVFAGASMNPASVLVLVDGFAAIGAEGTDADCYGNTWSYPAGDNWWMDDPSIAAMSYGSGSDQVMGIAPGETRVWASWRIENYIYDGQDCRDYGASDTYAFADVVVAPVKFTRVAQEFGVANFDAGITGQTFNATLSLPSNSPPCTGNTFNMRVYLEKGVNVTLVPGTDARTNISTADDSQYRISGGGLTTESASSPNPSFNAVLKRISPNNPNRPIIFTVGSKDQSGRFTTTPGNVTITCN